MPKYFWMTKTLEELDDTEWESLCDHCGLCCLVRAEDEDTGKVFPTSVVCSSYNCSKNQCNAYETRDNLNSECVKLTPALVREFDWLPDSCAYRCVLKSQPLPETHPLLSKDPLSTVTVTTLYGAYGLIPYSDDLDLEDHIINDQYQD